MEMVKGVKNIIELDFVSKKGLVQLIIEILQFDLINKVFVKSVLEFFNLKGSFLVIGFGYEFDVIVVENDDGWELNVDYDLCKCFWYVDVKCERKLVVIEFYVDILIKKIIIFIGMLVYQQSNFVGVMFYDVELIQLV